MEEMLKKVKSCYGKIKRYYYENYGLLLYKKKIADFECTRTFEKKLINLAEKLYYYVDNKNYFTRLIDKVSILELSKNIFYIKGKLDVKSNYFADLPIELLIIDALIVCEFGVLLQDIIRNETISENNINFKSYNNQLDFSSSNVYENHRLFKHYKCGYDDWKKEPYNIVVEKEKCTVFKLDIKECYYSAKYDCVFFYKVARKNKLLSNLLDIYFKLASKYKTLVNLEKKDKIKNQCFPVGLLSSNVLFEYYMYMNVDSKILEHPELHLARYADDMIFVCDETYRLDEFFKQYNDVFTVTADSSENKSITIRSINDTGFDINNSKIRKFNFKKNDPYCKYKIKKLFEKNNLSEQNIIEFELSEKPKYDSNGNETDMNILRKAQKIMDIYLDYGIVDENDTLIKTFKNDIKKLFSSYKLINYRTSWTRLLEFIILVYNKSLLEIQELIDIANKTISKKLKRKKLLVTTLLNELAIAILLAQSSHDIKTKNNSSIRKALMFKIFEKNVSLKISSETNEYVPYYISEDERLFYDLLNPTFEYPYNSICFSPIASIRIDRKKIIKDNFSISYVDFDKYLQDEEIPQIGCIVANILLEKKSVEDVLKRGTLTYRDKKIFLDVLDSAKKIRKTYGDSVKYLVLPEFFLDYLWIKDVIDFCKETGITVITGMMLKKYIDSTGTKKVINNLFYFIPYKETEKYTKVFIGKREKNDYSPEEEECFARLKMWHNEFNPNYHIIKKDNFIYTPLLCYEFTNPEARYVFNGVVHGVFVSELNQDTNYFSSIIHSTARELHSFVIQANSSKFGDNRITIPSSTHKMDLVSVKGGLNCTLHYAKLDLKELLESEKLMESIRDEYRNGRKASEYKSIFKKTSAGFKRISFKEFINNNIDVIN